MTSKLLLAASAIAATAALPTMANAQAIGVVDSDRIATTCNACVPALQTLQAEAQALQAQQQQAQQSLGPQAQALQAEINALGEAQPSADLQQRIAALRTQEATAIRGLQARQQTLARNRNYVLQQISAAIEPAYRTVIANRSLSVLFDSSQTLGHAAAVDVTNDVLAQLNTTLTTINTTAPAPQQTQPQTTPAPGR